jgi:hypothetical protein
VAGNGRVALTVKIVQISINKIVNKSLPSQCAICSRRKRNPSQQAKCPLEGVNDSTETYERHYVAMKISYQVIFQKDKMPRFLPRKSHRGRENGLVCDLDVRDFSII